MSALTGKQSEKARQYLLLKENLKTNDINAFLLEMESTRATLTDIDNKLTIAADDLDKSNREYESTKAEYEAAEQRLSELQTEIENEMSLKSETDVEKGRLNGQMNVMSEQIKTIRSNESHYNDRIGVIHQECARLETQKSGFLRDREELAKELDAIKLKQDNSENEHKVIIDEITRLTAEIEAAQNEMYEILNEKSNIKTENQRYETMLEQINIRRAELNSRVIQGKSDESAQIGVINGYAHEASLIQDKVNSLTGQIKEYEAGIASCREKIAELTSEIDKTQQQYHRERSRLESLRNIAERYDGYGNSIRKVMERKTDNDGILGVVADIIKVQKQYEVAIETALGGTIQNIVTDNEQTAKGLIAYLKENKFGRATFLPLSSISGRNTLEKDACLNEKGVVGIASRLVRVSFEYENLEIRLNDDIEMTGNALTMDFTGFNKYEADKLMILLVSQLQDRGVSKASSSGRNVRFKNCGIGTNIVIDANGRIYPCNKFSSYYRGLGEDMVQIFEDFNELNRKTSTDFIAKCSKCELRYICAGGCRIDYMNRHGDMLAVDCNPEFKENQYRKLLLDYLE